MVWTPGDDLELAGGRHDHQVAKVAEPTNATHAGMAKAFYRYVLIGVAGRVVAAGDRAGPSWTSPNGVAGPGKVLPSPRAVLVLAPIRGFIERIGSRSDLASATLVHGNSALRMDNRVNPGRDSFASTKLLSKKAMPSKIDQALIT